MRRPRSPWLLLPIVLAGLLSHPGLDAQEISRVDRQRAERMLKQVREDVEQHFYDATFNGIDLAARFEAARAKIATAGTHLELFGGIAEVLFDLEDSHTYFYPPGFNISVDYGWDMQFVGDTCRVTEVRPGSDAAGQGLTPGDAILSVNGNVPTRANLDQLLYVYYVLRPQRGLRVVARAPGAEPRQLDLAARVRQHHTVIDLTGSDGGASIRDLILMDQAYADRMRARSLEFEDGLLIWRLPQFSPHNVETLVKDMRGKKSLILDLRGNGGGRVSSLQELLGSFFPDTVPIGTMVDRRGSHPLAAKGRGSRAFTGELIVLVDAGSASAAELFARTIQLRGRGRVIGDRTAGAVVASRLYQHEIGGATVIAYATNVAVADMVMADGGRLERIGVTPDLVLRPSGADLAARRDPVLTEAARLLHHELAAKDIRWFRHWP